MARARRVLIMGFLYVLVCGAGAMSGEAPTAEVEPRRGMVEDHWTCESKLQRAYAALSAFSRGAAISSGFPIQRTMPSFGVMINAREGKMQGQGGDISISAELL